MLRVSIKQPTKKKGWVVNPIRFSRTVLLSGTVITATLLLSIGCSKNPEPNKKETAKNDAKAATEPEAKKVAEPELEKTPTPEPASSEPTPKKTVKQLEADPNRVLEARQKMMQIMLALHNYADQHGMFNPDTKVSQNYASNGQPHLSWRVHILPQLGQAELYGQFKLDEPWDSPHNKKLLAKMPDLFRTPGDPADTTTTRFRAFESKLETSYSQPRTMLSITPGRRATRLRDVTDGLSNTVMLVETAPEKATPWTKPDGLPLLSDNPTKAFGPIGPEGILAAFGDGAVKILRPDISPDVWSNLLNFADGQRTPDDISLPLPLPKFIPRTNGPLHLAYIKSPYVTGIVVIRPKAMAETAQATTILTKLNQGGIIPSLKSMRELDKVIIWLDGLDSYFLLQFAAPTARETVIKKFGLNPEIVWEHDQRTWLVAPKELAKEFIASDDKPLESVRMWEGMDLNHQVALRYVMLPSVADSVLMKSVFESLHIRGLSLVRLYEGTLDLSGEAILEVKLGTTTSDLGTLIKDQIQQRLKTSTTSKISPEIKTLAKSLTQDLTLTQTSHPFDTSNKKTMLVLKLKNTTHYANAVTFFDSHILQPAMKASVVAKRENKKTNNMKQIGLAFLNFHDSYGHFPPNEDMLVNGKPLLSWRVYLLPFLDQYDLYKKFQLNEPWDSPHNKKLLDQMPDIYKTKGVDQPGKTSIMTFSGKGTPFSGGPGIRIREIKDGLSNTILCVEAGPDKAVPWTQPIDLPFDPKNPKKALGQLEKDHFLVLKMDGAAISVPTNISAEKLRKMIRHNDY